MIGQDIAAVVRVEWSALREEAARAGLPPRRRRRAIARIALACTLAAAIATAAWPRGSAPIVAHAPPPPAPAAAHAPPPPAPEPPARSTEHVTVELASGTRRFEATPARVLEIHSGRVTVTSSNAVFACSRSERATHVEVLRGTVVVHAPDGERTLVAGQHDDFVEAHQTWRELARAGDYDHAYRNVDRVQQTAEDLMMVADVMRLSRHPDEAIAPLRQILAEHADDPRAALAAFTLGRMFLDELGRPRDAADAFATCQRLAPDGALAEDALAREVESWASSGEAVAAKLLAERYVRKYPDGHKLRSVRKLGGLE